MNAQKLRDFLKRLNGVNRELNEIEAGLVEELRKADGGEEEGLVFSELLMMSDPLRQVLLGVQRLEKASSAQIAEALDVDVETIEAQLQILAQQGHVIESRHAGQVVYRVVIGAKRPARLQPDIWNALDQRIEQAADNVYT